VTVVVAAVLLPLGRPVTVVAGVALLPLGRATA